MGNLMSKKRNYILYDDIVIRILSELSIKELLRVQTVCKQFQYCANEALKLKTGIRLGCNDKDMKCDVWMHSISDGNINKFINEMDMKYDIFRDLVNNIDVFISILKKCPNIKALYLNECQLDLQVMKAIVDNCKRLECMTFSANYCAEDLNAWQLMADIFANLKLKHLTFVDHGYSARAKYNKVKEIPFDKQIDCRMLRMASLKKLVLKWYIEPLVPLVDHLPQALEVLHLIRCSKFDADVVPHLSRENLPKLKEFKVDINFYGRNQENTIFSLICKHMSLLDKLVFYCDNPLQPQAFVHLTDTRISDLSIQLFEAHSRHSTNSFLTLPGVSSKLIRSLSMKNILVGPSFLKKLVKCFPLVENLELDRMGIRCVCPPDGFESDGESYLIHSYVNIECEICKEKAMNYLTSLKSLKNFTFSDIFHGWGVKNFKFIKEMKNLSRFTATNPYPRHNSKVIEQLALICLDICHRRRTTNSSQRLTVVLDFRSAGLLHKQILKITCKSVSNSLKIRYEVK